MSRSGDGGEVFLEFRALKSELAEARRDLQALGELLIEVRERLRRAHIGDPEPPQPDDGA